MKKLIVWGLLIVLVSTVYAQGAKTINHQTPGSDNVTAGAGFAHYIGQLYGGGIVAAVWKDSTGIEHGLIASLTDLSDSAAWSSIDTALIGLAAESFMDGLGNTKAIIAQPGHTGSAALLCHNYKGGGYTDWYLPAEYQLLQCYNQLFIINTILGARGFNTSAYYWSSTEANNNSAWYLSFSRGYQNAHPKDKPPSSVRAVRSY